MQRKVVVISAVQTFTVKGLVTKIGQQGFLVQHSGPTAEEIKDSCTEADLVVYYTDNYDARGKGGLQQLKDLIVGTGKVLVLIGTKEEYQLVTSVIPEESIREFFQRPFDMTTFLEKIQDHLVNAAMEEAKKVILVVDDDVNYLNTVREWLKSTYLVARANTGMQAIQWLAKNHADLVLLDYEMPVTSGAKMLEMLRSDEETMDIPVMFLTGQTDREKYLNVKEWKPVGYLLKTIDRAGLLKELRNYFASQEEQQQQQDPFLAALSKADLAPKQSAPEEFFPEDTEEAPRSADGVDWDLFFED